MQITVVEDLALPMFRHSSVPSISFDSAEKVLPRSAKGTDARRQTGEGLARPSGGAPDTVPVLRELFKSAKGADACRQTGEEPARPSDGASRLFDRSQFDRSQDELAVQSLDFDLHAAIEDVFEIVGVHASWKKLSLRSVLAEDVPVRLRGDAGKLKQILLHLLSNAVKFTEAGSVVLEVALAEPGGNKVRFQVIDTGIGIPLNGMHRLEKSFSQVDSAKSRFDGTGLGLAIAKRLARAMGGEIGVGSVPGQGSTFWFTARFSPAVATRIPKRAISCS